MTDIMKQILPYVLTVLLMCPSNSVAGVVGAAAAGGGTFVACSAACWVNTNHLGRVGVLGRGEGQRLML